MTSPEMQADLMNYLFAAAAATVTGVALNVACTIGHRENQRGKKDKSMRSQRGKKGGSQRSARGKKKGGSQRSLRKKKGLAGGAPAPAGAPPVAASKEPVKKSEQDKSARSKGGDKSARSKKQDGSNRGKKDASKKSKKSQKTKKSTAKKDSSKREKKPEAPPKEEEKEPTTAVLPPTPEAALVPESPVVPETPPSAPPAAAPVSQVSEPPKEAIETNNGIVTPDRPDSVMVDLCGGPGAGNPGDKSHRIYGTAGEAAVAEAKRQAELDRMKPKEQLDPGQSQYMK